MTYDLIVKEMIVL
uniref:Uncharacterized protein n=1 Tax=Moniliophthora roreri TaxID=221103 RepID=A0A0W0GFT3_MONRR